MKALLPGFDYLDGAVLTLVFFQIVRQGTDDPL
jgi:hypothetical protein